MTKQLFLLENDDMDSLILSKKKKKKPGSHLSHLSFDNISVT